VNSAFAASGVNRFHSRFKSASEVNLMKYPAFMT